MPRVTIDIQAPFIYSTEIDIRVSDINYGQHVGHDTLISILHEARVRFLIHHGFDEADTSGTGLVIADLAICYLSQAFYPERLKVDIAVADFNKYGCDIYYQVFRSETEELVLKAKTGILFYDYQTRKVAPVPKDFLARFNTPD